MIDMTSVLILWPPATEEDGSHSVVGKRDIPAFLLESDEALPLGRRAESSPIILYLTQPPLKPTFAIG